MRARIVLGDGGPLHRPAAPLGLHPHLRAAAHLLLRGEERFGGLVASLRREVFCAVEVPAWSPAARAVTGPRRSWGAVRSAVSASAEGGEREIVGAALAWAARRHLAGVYVLELLVLTLLAWGQLTREAQTTREAMPPPQGAAGWGPWVDVLTTSPAEADIGPLLEGAGGLRPRLRPRAPREIHVALTGWAPELETWETAEARLRSEVETALVAHRRRCEAQAGGQGLEAVPVAGALRHFDWLAARQIAGWRPSRIAKRFGVAVSTVHAALSRTADLVGLELRPVKPGPEEVLGG